MQQTIFLTVPTEVEEKSIEIVLKRMYELDFAEPKLQNSFGKFNLSFNLPSKNFRFLELRKNETVMVDAHYQFQLKQKLKQKEVVLPENRVAAIRHMQSLKKRFDRNRKFFYSYKSFIDKL